MRVRFVIASVAAIAYAWPKEPCCSDVRSIVSHDHVGPLATAFCSEYLHIHPASTSRVTVTHTTTNTITVHPTKTAGTFTETESTLTASTTTYTTTPTLITDTSTSIIYTASVVPSTSTTTVTITGTSTVTESLGANCSPLPSLKKRTVRPGCFNEPWILKDISSACKCLVTSPTAAHTTTTVTSTHTATSTQAVTVPVTQTVTPTKTITNTVASTTTDQSTSVTFTTQYTTTSTSVSVSTSTTTTTTATTTTIGPAYCTDTEEFDYLISTGDTPNNGAYMQDPESGQSGQINGGSNYAIFSLINGQYPLQDSNYPNYYLTIPDAVAGGQVSITNTDTPIQCEADYESGSPITCYNAGGVQFLWYQQNNDNYLYLGLTVPAGATQVQAYNH